MKEVAFQSYMPAYGGYMQNGQYTARQDVNTAQGMQGYPQLSPPIQTPQQSNQPGFICRPVASYDEAKATPTDFMGNLMVLTDLSHGMIYTKILDPNTGSSVFRSFQQVPEQQAAPAAPAYDPRPDIQRLREELASLRAELEETKKGAKRPASKGGGES